MLLDSETLYLRQWSKAITPVILRLQYFLASH